MQEICVSCNLAADQKDLFECENCGGYACDDHTKICKECHKMKCWPCFGISKLTCRDCLQEANLSTKKQEINLFTISVGCLIFTTVLAVVYVLCKINFIH